MVIDTGKCGGDSKHARSCKGHTYTLEVTDFAFTKPSDHTTCENCGQPGECAEYASFHLCVRCIRAASIGFGLVRRVKT